MSNDHQTQKESHLGLHHRLLAPGSYMAVGLNFQGITALLISLLLMLLGIIVLGYGLAHLARGKGHNPLWCLAAVVNGVGILALLLMPDKRMAKVPLVCQNCGYSLRGSNAEDPCPECGHVNVGEK